jgi:hypothetical protein
MTLNEQSKRIASCCKDALKEINKYKTPNVNPYGDKGKEIAIFHARKYGINPELIVQIVITDNLTNV